MVRRPFARAASRDRGIAAVRPTREIAVPRQSWLRDYGVRRIATATHNHATVRHAKPMKLGITASARRVGAGGSGGSPGRGVLPMAANPLATPRRRLATA